MNTQKDQPLYHVPWSSVKDGDTVYLYAMHDGKEYGCGPFDVLDARHRRLTRCDSFRPFFHYPEELYKIT